MSNGMGSWTPAEWVEFAKGIGSVLTAIISAIGLAYARRANINAKASNAQTATRQYVDGEIHTVSVAEHAAAAEHNAADANTAAQVARQETADMHAFIVKGNGAHRYDTGTVLPVLRTPIASKPSTYTQAVPITPGASE